MKQYRVMICDDDALVRDGLSAILESYDDMIVAGIAEDGEQAVRLCRETSPDIILMDIRMPGTDGVRATGMIRKEFPGVKIMILTTFEDRDYIRSALSAGAHGYVLKSSPASSIVENIRTVCRGHTVLQENVARELPGMISLPEVKIEGLSPREDEILKLIAQGFSNKEIASQLSISDGTVRNYISEILVKTGTRDRTQLAVLYYRRRMGQE